VLRQKRSECGAGPENIAEELPRDDNFQNVVRAAYNDFKIRERRFLLAMSKSQTLKLTDGNHSDPMVVVCHQQHYFEFLLALKEVKPCTLFAHYAAQDILTEMVQQ